MYFHTYACIQSYVLASIIMYVHVCMYELMHALFVQMAKVHRMPYF